jgi:hypothetical protein
MTIERQFERVLNEIKEQQSVINHNNSPEGIAKEVLDFVLQVLWENDDIMLCDNTKEFVIKNIQDIIYNPVKKTYYERRYG